MKKTLIIFLSLMIFISCISEDLTGDSEEQSQVKEKQENINQEPQIEVLDKRKIVTYIHEDEFVGSNGYDMRMMIGTKMSIKNLNEKKPISRMFFKVERVKAINGKYYNNLQTMDQYDRHSIEIFAMYNDGIDGEYYLNFMLTNYDTRDLISESTNESFKRINMFNGDSLEDREYITEPEQYIYTSSLRGIDGDRAVQMFGEFLGNIETVYIKVYYKILEEVNGEKVEIFNFIEKQIELDFSGDLNTFQLNYTSYPMFTRIDSTFFIKELKFGEYYGF